MSALTITTDDEDTDQLRRLQGDVLNAMDAHQRAIERRDARIRELAADGVPKRALARIIQCDPANIHRIIAS
jgi:hypothetical protein